MRCNNGRPTFRDSNIDLTPDWLFFDVLEFKQMHQKKEYKKNPYGVKRPGTSEGQNGKFFPY